MSQVYEVRLKAAALDNLRSAREELRRQLGTAKVGQRLIGLQAAEAGELANALLSLLDCVDGIVTRAKPVA